MITPQLADERYGVEHTLVLRVRLVVIGSVLYGVGKIDGWVPDFEKAQGVLDGRYGFGSIQAVKPNVGDPLALVKVENHVHGVFLPLHQNSKQRRPQSSNMASSTSRRIWLSMPRMPSPVRYASSASSRRFWGVSRMSAL